MSINSPIAHTFESVLLSGQGLQKRSQQFMLLVLLFLIGIGFQGLNSLDKTVQAQMANLKQSRVLLFTWTKDAPRPDDDQFVNWQNQITQIDVVAAANWQNTGHATSRALVVKLHNNFDADNTDWHKDIDTNQARVEQVNAAGFVSVIAKRMYEINRLGWLILGLAVLAVLAVLAAQIQARLLLDLPNIALLHTLGATDGYIVQQVVVRHVIEIAPAVILGSVAGIAAMAGLIGNIDWLHCTLLPIVTLCVIMTLVFGMTHKIIRRLP